MSYYLTAKRNSNCLKSCYSENSKKNSMNLSLIYYYWMMSYYLSYSNCLKSCYWNWMKIMKTMKMSWSLKMNWKTKMSYWNLNWTNCYLNSNCYWNLSYYLTNWMKTENWTMTSYLMMMTTNYLTGNCYCSNLNWMTRKTNSNLNWMTSYYWMKIYYWKMNCYLSYLNSIRN